MNATELSIQFSVEVPNIAAAEQHADYRFLIAFVVRIKLSVLPDSRGYPSKCGYSLSHYSVELSVNGEAF